MTDSRLSDEEWGTMRAFVRQEPQAYIGRDASACRRFVEAVQWRRRSGAHWRLLPGESGAWNRGYQRWVRWCEAGIWERMLAALATDPDPDPDPEHGMRDATSGRAPPWAAGAPNNTGRKRSGGVAAGSVARFPSPWMG
jgi:putative transposase